MGIETIKHGGKQMVKNWIINLTEMRDRRYSSPINSLTNVNKKRPCIIVAAGPSLNKDIKLLDSFKGVVIAVDTALGPMVRNCYSLPDYVTSIDYSDITYEKFLPVINGDLYKELSLIHIPEVCSKVVKIPFYRKYYAYHGDTYKEAFDDLLRVKGQSVWRVTSGAHLALFSAVIMGCDPIALAGHDYQTGNKSHADGTVSMWPDTIKGKAVFREQLELQEQIIKFLDPVHKPIVINCSGGKDIQGTSRAKLSYFIERFSEKGSIKQTINDQMDIVIQQAEQYQKTDAEIVRASVDDSFSKSHWAKMTHGMVLANTGDKYFSYKKDTPQIRDFLIKEIGIAADELKRMTNG